MKRRTLAVFASLVLVLAAGCSKSGNKVTNPTPKTYAQTVLEVPPRAYWRMNETAGTTAVSAVNSPTFDAAYGGTFTFGAAGAVKGDKAITFDQGTLATTSSIGDSLFTGRTVVAVECWLRPIEDRGYAMYFIVGASGFSLEGSTLNPTFFVNNTDMGQISTPLNVYTHVVAQIDGAKAQIFVNGALVHETAFSDPIANTGSGTGKALKVGSDGGGTSYVHGEVDEVAVYGRALTAGEIAAHYAAAPN